MSIAEKEGRNGTKCASIVGNDTQGAGAWTQCISAKSFQGKFFVITGYIMTDKLTSGFAGIWARVDGPDDSVQDFDNMANRGVKGTTQWKRCQISLYVPENSARICFGMLMNGKGCARADDLSITAYDISKDEYACSTAPVSAKGIGNLVVLAKVWGNVKYFYGGTDILSYDFDERLLSTIKHCEAAANIPILGRSINDGLLAYSESVRLGGKMQAPGTKFPEPGQEIIESKYIYILPDYNADKFELPKLDGIDAVLVDLRRSTAASSEQVSSVSRKFLPLFTRKEFASCSKRSIRHHGFAGNSAGVYSREVALTKGDRIKPLSDALPEFQLILLIDSTTSPDFAEFVIPMADDGVCICAGSSFCAYTGSRFEVDINEDIRLYFPLSPLIDRKGNVRSKVVAKLYSLGLDARDSALKYLREKRDEEKTVGERTEVPVIPQSCKLRQIRLAAAIVLWNVLEHFYPYWDVVKADWSAALPKFLQAAAQAKSPDELKNMLREMLALAQDGHGFIAVPESPDKFTSPEILLGWVENKIIVTHSGDAAVKPGMEIVEIDGKNAAELLDIELRRTSGATDQFRRYSALSRLLCGDPGTEVQLVIVDSNGKQTIVKVMRNANAHELQKQSALPDFKMLEKGIAYVNLDKMTDDRFKAVLKDLCDAEGVIFDLRGYPSAISTDPIAHIITDKVKSQRWNVPVRSSPDKAQTKWEVSGWDVLPKNPKIKGKVAFITDGRAISYAETYMALVRDSKAGTIIGQTTAGTNGNITTFTLPGNISVTFTGMRVLNNDGSTHHGVGIKPDIEVLQTRQGMANGTDEFLKRAIEVVKK